MASRKPAQSQRGRHAEKPTQISGAGWLDVLWRVKNNISRDYIPVLAAGIAFYGLLATFPIIVAIISTWAIIFDPRQMADQISLISQLLPQAAADLIIQQADKTTENIDDTGISLAAIGALLLAIYSASRGMYWLMQGLNIIYDEQESRGLIKKAVITLLLTIGAITMTIIALGVIAVIPVIIKVLPLDDTIAMLIRFMRWPLLMVIVMLAVAVIYRYAPDRDEPRWHWISIGSIVAVLLWLLGSVGFSVYVSNFTDFNQIYGSLGAVVILLLWFWLSAFIILVGAELNSEMEHQTQRDTTIGYQEPMGERGAHVADTVGEKKKRPGPHGGGQ